MRDSRVSEGWQSISVIVLVVCWGPLVLVMALFKGQSKPI
jgi:hypothetical protein